MQRSLPSSFTCDPVHPALFFNSGVYVKFPFEGFTFAWYVDLFSREPLLNAFWNSVKVRVSSACFAPLSPSRPHWPSRATVPGRPAVAFIMLPLVLPGLILGVALLTLLNRLGVQLSRGHRHHRAYRDLPAFRDLGPSAALHWLQPVWLEEASADLGEPPLRTFWRVTLPCNMPGILACLLMTFTISFDEFFMAFFLSGAESTLPCTSGGNCVSRRISLRFWRWRR